MSISPSSFVLRPSSIRTAPRGGTVLMEAVLCLPLLLFLVTGLVQFARIWEAKLMTRHAAYNAARATLVYNVDEYATTNKEGKVIFKTHGGIAWLAAVNTLAWKSATSHATLGTDANHAFPGFEGEGNYRIESSAFIRDQVRIVQPQSWESNGLVRVTVQFDFPLLFSIFALGSMWGDPEGRDDIGPGSDVPLVHDTSLDTKPRTAWNREIPHIRLTEGYVMPKPWSTKRYPRVSGKEAVYLEMPVPSQNQTLPSSPGERDQWPERPEWRVWQEL